MASGTNCKLPCYTQPKFDYSSMNCYLKSKSVKSTGKMNVVYMVKDHYNPGSFVYREKPVLYFVPKDDTSKIPLAYLIPGHSDDYVYMYMLSVALGRNTYSGEHFTFGNKTDGNFDLHYTTYDYVSGNKPYHIYYDLHITNETTPQNISSIVCRKQGTTSRNELNNRCYFFDAVMQAIHTGSCQASFQQTHDVFSKSAPSQAKGGSKRQRQTAKPQNGGDIDIDATLKNSLSDIFTNIKELAQIEIHNMQNNIGTLTFFIEGDVESIIVNDDSAQQQKHTTLIPYAFPYDFSNNQFMSLDEFASLLRGDENNKSWRKSIIDLCPSDITNLYFSDSQRMKTTKGCATEANAGKVLQNVFYSPLPVAAGGKQKTEKNKSVKKVGKK